MGHANTADAEVEGAGLARNLQVAMRTGGIKIDSALFAHLAANNAWKRLTRHRLTRSKFRRGHYVMSEESDFAPGETGTDEISLQNRFVSL